MKSNFLLIILGLCSLPLFTACDENTEPNYKLNNTVWMLNSIESNGSKEDVDGKYKLTLPDNSSFSIEFDVNTCGGSMCLETKNEIHFDGFMCTEACCDLPLAEEVKQIMLKSGKYDHDGSNLRISDGKKTLHFSALK